MRWCYFLTCVYDYNNKGKIGNVNGILIKKKNGFGRIIRQEQFQTLKNTCNLINWSYKYSHYFSIMYLCQLVTSKYIFCKTKYTLIGPGFNLMSTIRVNISYQIKRDLKTALRRLVSKLTYYTRILIFKLPIHPVV